MRQQIVPRQRAYQPHYEFRLPTYEREGPFLNYAGQIVDVPVDAPVDAPF